MKKLSLIYKLLIIVISGFGLYLNFKFLGIKTGLLYFTIISNLACFIFYLVAFILFILKRLKKNDTYYITKGLVTISITLTMILYNFVLVPHGNTGYEGHSFECMFVHLLTPGLIILDYVIFGEKGHLKKIYPVIWSLFLIIYTVFTGIYIVLGGTFFKQVHIPYYFMNASELGTERVIMNLIAIYVCFMSYGFLVQKLDEVVGREYNNG